MKRLSLWTIFILFYALLCMPILSEALTVTISKVDPTWIPEASTSTNLSIATVIVTISGIDKRTDQYKRIEVTLKSSDEAGICCNANANYGTTKDLIFTVEDNRGNWEVVNNAKLRYELPSDLTNTPDTLDLPVNVRSLDYGGYGKVSVGVMKRQKGYTDRYETDGSATVGLSSKIPKDDIGNNNKGNNIADAWEYDRANLTAGEDQDTSPNTQNRGDRLTAYEEYRGFMTLVVVGRPAPVLTTSLSHTRTSPSTKDMFVVNEDSTTRSAGTGSGLPHISQHLVPSTHVNADGRVNFNENKGLFAYSAKVVSSIIAVEDTPLGTAPLGPPGPGEDGEATIYTEKIRQGIGRSGLATVISRVIGHELGHLAHLGHCPKTDEPDANKTSWKKRCRLWPTYFSDQSVFASHHDPDYALATPLGPPQEAVETDKHGNLKKLKASLSPASGSSNTATAGDSHTANFTAPSAYNSVYWYVKSPTDTSAYGTTIEIDQGNGTLTTADFTYTFPSGVSGTYQIMAYTYMSDNTIAEPSYTVSVSTSTSTPTPTPAPAPTPPATPPTVSLVPDSDSVTLGETIGATLTLGAAPSYVFWYVQQPWELSPGTLLSQDTSGSLTSLFSLSTSGWNSGLCTITVSGTWASDGSAFTQSTWITLSQ